VKIGSVKSEIIVLQEIIKKKTRKKLTQAEHIALSANMFSGLENSSPAHH